MFPVHVSEPDEARVPEVVPAGDGGEVYSEAGAGVGGHVYRRVQRGVRRGLRGRDLGHVCDVR